MTIKRYELDIDEYPESELMREHHEGAWVKHSDVIAILEESVRITERSQDLCQQIQARQEAFERGHSMPPAPSPSAAVTDPILERMAANLEKASTFVRSEQASSIIDSFGQKMASVGLHPSPTLNLCCVIFGNLYGLLRRAGATHEGIARFLTISPHQAKAYLRTESLVTEEAIRIGDSAKAIVRSTYGTILDLVPAYDAPDDPEILSTFLNAVLELSSISSSTAGISFEPPQRSTTCPTS
jgi:hypothetical protein